MKYILLCGSTLIFGCQHRDHGEATHVSAYAGQENREIKALPASQVRDILDGKGMGYAMAAELNGYPGPRHVMELADSLDLSPEQIDQVEQAFQVMHDSARALGERYVSVERDLDRLFAEGRARGVAVRELTESAGRLDARIRYVHLEAHVWTHEILSEKQIGVYMRLRGYSDRADTAGEHRHDRHDG